MSNLCPNTQKNLANLEKEGLEELFIQEKLYKAKLEIRTFTRNNIVKEINIEPKDVDALIALFEIMDKTNKLKITIVRQRPKN